MSITSPGFGHPEPVTVIETIQDFYSAILEYYDELFPLDATAVDFFVKLQALWRASYPAQPVPMYRYLGVGCATGNLENRLAGPGFDITAIDRNPEMVETAKRRMKRGFSGIRFFEMSSLDMSRFLKKGSFNIIASLSNTLPYIADETLIRKFFHDARELLAPDGDLVVQLWNFDRIEKQGAVRLPDASSVRVSLSRSLTPQDDGFYLLDASLELGSGRKIALQRGTRLYPATSGRLEKCAREAGFTSCSLYADYSGTPWSEDSPYSLMIFR